MNGRSPSALARLGLATLLALSAGCSRDGAGPAGPIVDTTAPTVSSTNPNDGATGVAAITATFSESMTISTISAATFSVTRPGAGEVPGTVSYGDLSNTATFTPASALARGTIYMATITTGVEDVSGNAMAVNKVWTFTTAATPLVPTAPNVPSTPRTY
jgi:hypothetical protein